MKRSACSISGCVNPGRLRRGWCEIHYRRWRRTGNPLGIRPHSGSKFSEGNQLWKLASHSRPITHGHATKQGKSRTYRAWINMIQRCTNSHHPRYADWGGRGITVCERWLSFKNFLADMGEAPAGKSLDRFPDNDGNYEPVNVRWATAREQQSNRRSRAI